MAMLLGCPWKQEGASPFLPPGSQLPTSIPTPRDWEAAAGKAMARFSEPHLPHHNAGSGKVALELRGHDLLTTWGMC